MPNKLLIILIISMLSTMSYGQFAGGNGTADDPWTIETTVHLNNVRNYLGVGHSDKHFLQITEINLGVPPWNENNGWQPIGDGNNHFFGNYDGNGQIISGLTINMIDTNNLGLFGYVSGASLTDIKLTDVNILGNGGVGGLAGRSEVGTTIRNCSVSGTISASSQVGGLVGRTDFTLIEECYFTGVIVGSGNSVGGLAGINNDSSTIRCFADVSLTNTAFFSGGLVGFSNRSITVDSYATGSVNGGSNTGGLIGGNMNDSDVTNCYSAASVIGVDNVGGLLGTVMDSDITNSYWDTVASGQTTSAGGEGRTTGEMTYPYATNTFINWDFNDTWGADPDHSINDGYPYLLFYSDEVVLHPPENLTADAGDGIVLLNWDEPFVGFPINYNVYRDDDIIANPIESQYEDTDVENDITYTYFVTAVYDEGESGSSNTVEATPQDLFLHPPQNLTFKIFDLDVLLEWEAPEYPELSTSIPIYSNFLFPAFPILLGYNVYRDDELLNIELISDTEYIDVNPVPDFVYTYYVTAVYEQGESDPSNEVVVNITDIHETTISPSVTELKQNYPNPFNIETTIRFTLHEDEFVNISVYNILGQKIATLVDKQLDSGFHSIVWDGKDKNNYEVASGIYFYRMETRNYQEMRKMILLK